MPSRPGFVGLALSLWALAACGGTAAARRTAVARPVTLAAGPAAVAPVASVREDPIEMRTSGLTGSLSAPEARGALERRFDAFAACLPTGRRASRVGGTIRLAFRIGGDGAVRSVHPVDSTVGDRALERCVLDVAAGTRFPRPHGGEADFEWPLALDPPVGAREPASWDPSRVASVVARHGDDTLRVCRPDGSDASFQVTAWVSRTGRVTSAGAAVSDPGALEHVDCVLSAVRRWRMPRALRTAKVTFDLR